MHVDTLVMHVKMVANEARVAKLFDYPEGVYRHVKVHT